MVVRYRATIDSSQALSIVPEALSIVRSIVWFSHHKKINFARFLWRLYKKKNLSEKVYDSNTKQWTAFFKKGIMLTIK